jgi:peptidoglycan/LPS O-acetylase OafA/YrhL
MQKSGVILTGIKFAYLIVFFALLSGVFYLIIEQQAEAFSEVVYGVLILFVGLAGALCLYKASTSEKRQKIYMIAGFAILTLALFLVFSISGRLI